MELVRTKVKRPTSKPPKKLGRVAWFKALPGDRAFALKNDAQGFSAHLHAGGKLIALAVPPAGGFEIALHPDQQRMLVVPDSGEVIFEVTLGDGKVRQVGTFQGNGAGVDYLAADDIALLTTEQLFVVRKSKPHFKVPGPSGGRFVGAVHDRTVLLVSTDPEWEPLHVTSVIALDGKRWIAVNTLDQAIDEVWTADDRTYVGMRGAATCLELVGLEDAVAKARKAAKPAKLA